MPVAVWVGVGGGASHVRNTALAATGSPVRAWVATERKPRVAPPEKTPSTGPLPDTPRQRPLPPRLFRQMHVSAPPSDGDVFTLTRATSFARKVFLSAFTLALIVTVAVGIGGAGVAAAVRIGVGVGGGTRAILSEKRPVHLAQKVVASAVYTPGRAAGVAVAVGAGADRTRARRLWHVL